MTQIHTSYEFSKKLKAFLGEGAPEPMDNFSFYCKNCHKRHTEYDTCDYDWLEDKDKTWAYQLHDLLSKRFCEAMFKKSKGFEFKGGWVLEDDAFDLSVKINSEYWDGGLPAVEHALTEMMEAK